MKLKVAINGFGRIGRVVTRIVSKRDDLELVAINIAADPKMAEYILRYDSVHGYFDAHLEDDGKRMKIGNQSVLLSNTKDINEIDFNGADVVIECTGAFLTTEKAKDYLKYVKKVVMSAPAKDDTPMYVIGVNHTEYKGERIVSNASCTTNCLAPIAKVLHREFGIERGLMTTIHSYTNDQNILDNKHKKDLRRARAAALNMIPTTTGAARAVGKVLPELNGKLNGFAVRVPTPDVSVVDLTVSLAKSVSVESINQAFENAAKGEFKGLILVDNDKCVSSDFIGSTYSSIFVPDTTQVIDGKLAKVLAWYDNEWGYSSRLVDMATYIGQH
ncbi:MAG: type I glyceraldehyde-3-phosphate dehydrogenase [Helicobacteraceae bacterium]